MKILFPGLKYENLKTGNIYLLVDVVFNANNDQKGLIVIYQDVESLKKYGRDYEEFRLKFKVADY